MTEESETPPPPTVVRAKFGFDGRNNDELSFKKNDMITLTQEIEGGWWEGTINGKTGWFPCDYAIKEHQETRLRSKSPSGLRSNDVSVPSQSTKGVYRTIVLKDFVESEKAHVTELQALFRDYLQPLRAENVLDKQSCDTIVSNIELIIEQQLEILQSVEQFLSSPNAQQRVGGVLLSLAPNMKHLLRAYCENHPKAVEILNEKRELLEAFVQKHEGTMKAFITGLSKPFRHLQKYASTLQELERNIEEGHPDRGDTQRAASVYRDLAHFCSHIRKQKEMQIELLSTGLIRDWVGDAPITSFGDIKYMGTVSVQNNAGEPEDRCLVAFSTVMFVLEITPELNSYILKRRITMKGATVRKLETPQHTLQISEANEDKVLEITLPSSEEMNHWLEALTSCERVHMHESCNTISPTVPSQYGIGHILQTDLSPLKKPQVSIMPSPTHPAHAELVKKSGFDHELQMIVPEADDVSDNDSGRRPLSSTKKPRLYSGYCLRPYPPPRGNFAIDFSKKSAVRMRKGVPSVDQEDAQILKAIEVYCVSSSTGTRHNPALVVNNSPQLIVAEDEKIFVEEMVGDTMVLQEKSLVDTVYALKDQITTMQKDIDRLCKTVEKEQRARRRMEELFRRNSLYSTASNPKQSTPNGTEASNESLAVRTTTIWTRLGRLGKIWSAGTPSPSVILRTASVMPSVDSTAAISTRLYPQARRDDCVIDDFHGEKVCDPYRWLEDPDAAETQEYVNQLNAITTPFLEACEIREKLSSRLTELWDYEKYGCTSKRGKHYFYSYNSGLQNQSVIYIQESLTGAGKVFLDPNILSDDGTTSIRQQSWSDDGTLLAYGLSEKGSDWVTVKFRQSPSAQDLPDAIAGVKHSGLDWLKDNSGVFYSKYPDQKSEAVGSSTEKHQFHSLYFHKLGTEQSEDVLCVDFRDEPDYMISGEVSDDGKYLVVNVSKGCDPANLLYYYDIEAVDNKITGKLNLKPLFDKFDAKYDFIINDGSEALILTNHNAPMFKLVQVDMKNPDKDSWKTLIAENPACKLDWVAPVAGDKLIVAYLEDVKNTLYVHDLKTGKRLYQLPLDIGSVTGFFGKKKLNEMFFSFESFLTPTIVYHVDLSQDGPPKPKELRRVSVKGFDPSAFTVKQVFYTSKDGTKVPMFILYKNSLPLDGNNPTLLNGYGGFNIADTPYFSVSRLMVLQHMNGVVACANLRGGSEYGEKWHEGGMLDKKQNVFDDFIAAAEYLIENKYTKPERLCIHGGSNGGLLVAACAQQRPELFGAVLNRVGVLDMLRFHKFTIGAAWLPEFGNPDDCEHFKFIYKYSPLHNLTMPASGQLPAMLLMTADHDDRVVPLHSLKYIAQLYHVVKDSPVQTNPLLIRVEVRAGHGAGKPTTKIIEELVDMYSFMTRVLKIKWSD